MRLWKALPLLVLAGAIPWAVARADGPGEISVAVLAVDDSAFPEVGVVFTADLNGRPLTALAAEAIEAREGGVAAEVVAVEVAAEASIPMALVITLDVSGSVVGATLAEAQAAATALVGGLGAGDSAALVSFADEVQVVQPLTGARSELVAAIAGLQPGGNTALYDGVAQSAALAAGSGVARRAVVLFSDGQDYGGRSVQGREQSLAAAASGRVLFYVVAIGSQVDRAYLSELATLSGGRLFEATGPGEVPALLASLQGHLRSQFVATLRSRAEASARERSVEIRLAQGAASGVASKAYSSLRTAPVPTAAAAGPAAEEPAPAAVEPPPPVAAAEREDGAGLSAAFWIPLFAVLAAAGVLVPVARRRLHQAAAVRSRGEDPVALPARAAPHAEQVSWQILVSGGAPTAPVGLGAAPLLVGSDSACEVCLTAAPGVAPEHARIWLRDGRPMVHHLAAGYVTLVGGRDATLASLSHGAEFAIGPYVLQLVHGLEAGRPADGGKPEVMSGDLAAPRISVPPGG